MHNVSSRKLAWRWPQSHGDHDESRIDASTKSTSKDVDHTGDVGANIQRKWQRLTHNMSNPPVIALQAKPVSVTSDLGLSVTMTRQTQMPWPQSEKRRGADSPDIYERSPGSEAPNTCRRCRGHKRLGAQTMPQARGPLLNSSSHSQGLSHRASMQTRWHLDDLLGSPKREQNKGRRKYNLTYILCLNVHFATISKTFQICERGTCVFPQTRTAFNQPICPNSRGHP